MRIKEKWARRITNGSHKTEDKPGPTNGKVRSAGKALANPPSALRAGGRIDSIDLARGIAVALMILSHGVNGLLPYEDFTGWGLIPVHLVTKFSSSLFIMVFGIALAIAYLPHVHSADWPRRRMKMILNGVVIFFWYKVLTIFELLYLAEPHQIVNTLLFGAFPSYVEILGFYAIALLWTPFLLAAWVRTPLLLRVASPILLALFSYLLSRHFHFWGIEPLQAILVEHEDYYTWGQLSRGPLVLLGLLLGELVVKTYNNWNYTFRLAGFLGLASVLTFTLFFILAGPGVYNSLEAIALNAGKHPPELLFMLFSMGGAILIFSLCLAGGKALASALRPITVIGTDALQAFIFHIFVIFVGFRYLLDLYHNVTYPFALTLTLLLIPATALWIKINSWIRKRR